MILIIECIVGCILFGLGIVGSILVNKVFWLQEYAPSVQKKFLSLYPEYKPDNRTESIVSIVIKKVIACLLFVLILLLMVYIAGAKGFYDGFLYCYIIWLVVDWFDVFVLDMGILANWKKVRLPGTEDMDKEYRSNNRKSIVEGFIGMAIGLWAAVIVGGFAMLLF